MKTSNLENKVEEVKHSPLPWIKSADTLPDYNVAVLVFIPQEDNHITVGMYDISNKWVLLDEYRLPDSQVTYWAPMIAEPDDKTYEPVETNEEKDSMSGQIRLLQIENYSLKESNTNQKIRIDELQGEVERLREKEIRGDRMIVDAEHQKTVLKSDVERLRQVLKLIERHFVLGSATNLEKQILNHISSALQSKE
jgi:hypothetical protein